MAHDGLRRRSGLPRAAIRLETTAGVAACLAALMACAGSKPTPRPEASPAGETPAAEARPSPPAPRLAPEVERQFDLLNANCARGGIGSCIEIGRLSERGERGFPRNPDLASEAYGFACMREGGEACQRLEQLLGADDTTPSDLGRVHTAFTRACAHHHQDGCVGLATMHAYGISVPESTQKTVQLLTQACEAKSGVACGRLAEFHRAGIGVKPSRDKAQELEDLACQLGRELACVAISKRVLVTTEGRRPGRYSWWSEYGTATDRALTTLRGACRKGEYAGCVEYALMTIRGTGLPKEVQAGRELLQAFCDDGYGRACEALGDFAREEAVNPAGAAEAFKWWQRGCQLRRGDACQRVGEALLHLRAAEGARPPSAADVSAGLAALEQACQLHSASGCRTLAVALNRGLGGVADPRRAAISNELACRWGAEDGCATPRAGRALRDR